LAQRWLASRQAAGEVETSSIEALDRKITRLEQNLSKRVVEYLRSGLPADSVRTAVDQVDSELTQLRAHRERVAAYQAAENGTSGRVQRTAELAMHAR